MPALGPIFFGREEGQPVQVGAVQLTPVVRALRLGHGVGRAGRPGAAFGLMRRSPVAVRVRDGRGERTLRVPDVQRMVGLVLLLDLLLVPMLSRLVTRRLAKSKPDAL